MISPLPLGLMTQVMDPIVKIWPGSGWVIELEKVTIWFAMDFARRHPTWRHCRQNLVGSLPRGMPTVVDESVKVRVRKLDGDTERKRQRFRQVQAVSLT
jgi:hypothetical protein